MQQVQCYQQGEYNYLNIIGDTGPIVYPAGHLYAYSLLSRFSIEEAQWVFGVIYIMTVFLVLLIYERASVSVLHYQDYDDDDDSRSNTSTSIRYRVAMGMCCLSRRIHSIYVLRLFNDGIAMLFLYASILMFVQSRWKIGSVFFSFAVSIKMNILLFAPGLLLLYLQAGQNIWFPLINLAICAAGQLLLGAPFLLRHPMSYLRKAFEFDRVFMYRWTVNWKVS